MAFTREALKDIGVSDEQVEGIMELHGKDIQSHKDDVEKYKRREAEAKEEVKSYKSRVDEQNGQLEDLQKRVKNGEDLEQTIEALKQDNKEKDAQHDKDMQQLKMEYEIDKALNEAGSRNTNIVKKSLDLDSINLNDKGELIGLQDQINSLKESDSYLFKNVDNATDDKGDINNTSNSNYSAGDRKGNSGKKTDATAVGEATYDRLFGKSE